MLLGDVIFYGNSRSVLQRPGDFDIRFTRARNFSVPHPSLISIGEIRMQTQYANAVSTDSVSSLFPVVSKYQGKNRRKHRRTPASVGIVVQALNAGGETTDSFFAITRDISLGGLGFLSSRPAEFDMALVTTQADPTRGVVVRICSCNLIQKTDQESVYLTSAEFLYERFA